MSINFGTISEGFDIVPKYIFEHYMVMFWGVVLFNLARKDSLSQIHFLYKLNVSKKALIMLYFFIICKYVIHLVYH